MAHGRLVEKFKNKNATVGIIGMGYVGLPLALAFADAGFKVLGFDNDQSKVDKLNAGKTYIKHISEASVIAGVQKGMVATSDVVRIRDCDALLICLPTPLTKHREPDLSYVVNTMDTICPYMRENQLLVLESTTYPGTTEEILLPYIKRKHFEVGKNYFLAFSPEREDPANPDYTTRTIPKVCGGTTKNCLEVAVNLYEQVIDKVVPVSSTQAAEMTKLLENIHRAVNIGLVNEMKIVADKMGVNIHEVIRAASTKPFGFTPYYPGPGLGGHCIPIDPFYLTWKAREYGINTRFIELAGEVNTAMPQFVVQKVTDSLNEKGKSVKGSRILILGLAYKKNVDDMRESPSVEIMLELAAKGADVLYSDPHVPDFPHIRKAYFDLHSVPLDAENICTFDAVVLVTNHDAFDYHMIQQNAQLLIDTRGVYREPHPNLVRA